MWPKAVRHGRGGDDELAGPARDVGVHVGHEQSAASRVRETMVPTGF
jgi:hypothetical protein